MSHIKIRFLMVAGVAAVLASSCGRNVPTRANDPGSFPAAQVETELGTLDRLFTQRGVQSLDRLADHLAAATPLADLPRTAELRALRTESTPLELRRAVEGMVRRLADLASRRAADPALAVIPPDLYGRTFAYDPDQGRYVVDPDRAGAPANGIRYVLYAEDPATHRPQRDQEIGTADITDEGVALPSGIALRLHVRIGDVDVLDYSVRILAGEQAGEVQVAGFASDGHDRANFEIALAGASADGASQFHLRFRLGLVDHDFTLVAAVDAGSSADDVHVVDQTTRIGDAVIHLAARAHADSIQAVIQVNGELFATAAGAVEHPTLLGRDGRPLSPAEHVALAHILAVVDHVHRLVGELLRPIAVILVLARP